jgi:hypothetical protein
MEAEPACVKLLILITLQSTAPTSNRSADINCYSIGNKRDKEITGRCADMYNAHER